MPRSLRRLRRSLGALLTCSGLALGVLSLPNAAQAQQASIPSPALLADLQKALGSGGASLSELLRDGPGLQPALVELRRRTLLTQFPDASWTLTPGPRLRDGRSTVELRLQGTHRQNGSTFRLDASQQLALTSSDGHITGQSVLREQSILRSGDTDLGVTLQIPDVVLTGQRYDVDVVFDEPLNGAVIAGGLLAITPSQTRAMEAPRLELGALGGGGLFKTVQAPYSPGEQTWAVLLVHPKGIVTATKRVRVVADRAQLTP